MCRGHSADADGFKRAENAAEEASIVGKWLIPVSTWVKGASVVW